MCSKYSAVKSRNRYERRRTRRRKITIERRTRSATRAQAASSACGPPRPAAAAAVCCCVEKTRSSHRGPIEAPAEAAAAAARSNSNALEREKGRGREREAQQQRKRAVVWRRNSSRPLCCTPRNYAPPRGARAREALVNNDPASRNYFRGTRRRLFFPRTTAFDSRSSRARMRPRHARTYISACVRACRSHGTRISAREERR